MTWARLFLHGNQLFGVEAKSRWRSLSRGGEANREARKRENRTSRSCLRPQRRAYRREQRAEHHESGAPATRRQPDRRPWPGIPFLWIVYVQYPQGPSVHARKLIAYDKKWSLVRISCHIPYNTQSGELGFPSDSSLIVYPLPLNDVSRSLSTLDDDFGMHLLNARAPGCQFYRAVQTGPGIHTYASNTKVTLFDKFTMKIHV